MTFDLFVQGLIAGYGIAIPIGPIAIIIIELGIRRGFWVAFCAGAGAASADLIYATIAALGGTFLVSILKPYSSIIHAVSAIVLIVIGLWLLYSGRNAKEGEKVADFRGSTRSGAYGMVFGLTLLNPLTIAYFTTLILGLRSNIGASIGGVVLFVSGAFFASLSWQTIVACIGGLGHERLSPKLRLVTFAVGNSIIVVLGVLLLFGFSI
ncbi:MAG TPA: LysE family transporter [Candidatus Acidoferrales bacterium]|nr:LysE family transporter [Candidatus Acidoferrales bacterium]